MNVIMLKEVIVACSLVLVSSALFAQQNVGSQPQVFFSVGFVTPQFFGGTELLNSNDIRNSGLSYYENSEGERAEVGSYGNNAGFSLSIGYYLPIRKVEGLSVGLLVNSGQTGTQPSEAGYEEGYFFNFLNFGAGLKYYPFTGNSLFIKGEVGMGSVFTKNRFINAEDNQDFLHHFGIGVEGGGGIGYTFRPFANDRLGLNLEAGYQYYNPRVEVSGIGDDVWSFGAASISVGVQF